MSDDSHHNIWTSIQELPTPVSLKKKHPAQNHHRAFQDSARTQINRVLDGACDRLVVIVGPCSIHDITAAREYATKLKALSNEVSDTLLLVMRVYFEKPRTALGWRGMLYDPSLDGSNDVQTGLSLTRGLLVDLCEMELPTATEFLSATTPQYLGDLITWGCIGARTVASQPHRQMASGLPMPVGLKNSTEGNIDLAINALITAREPHAFIGIDACGRTCVVDTNGNPYAHLVLRGGRDSVNYHASAVAEASRRLSSEGITTKLFVDCSHDNCGKVAERQNVAFENVVQQMVSGNRSIGGVLLESNIYSGRQELYQPPRNLQYAVSLTDPCIDWNTTEQLLRSAHKELSQARKSSGSPAPKILSPTL